MQPAINNDTTGYHYENDHAYEGDHSLKSGQPPGAHIPPNRFDHHEWINAHGGIYANPHLSEKEYSKITHSTELWFDETAAKDVFSSAQKLQVAINGGEVAKWLLLIAFFIIMGSKT